MVERLLRSGEAAHGRLRELIAAAAATFVIGGSIVALVVGRVDIGMTLAAEGDRLVIRHVEPGSPGPRPWAPLPRPV